MYKQAVSDSADTIVLVNKEMVTKLISQRVNIAEQSALFTGH